MAVASSDRIHDCKRETHTNRDTTVTYALTVSTDILWASRVPGIFVWGINMFKVKGHP